MFNLNSSSSFVNTTYDKEYILEFTSNCLNFQSNNLITGINIIDNLLLWTDNICFVS